MTIVDEFDDLSRWKNAGRILHASKVTAALKKLADERRIDTRLYPTRTMRPTG